MAGKFNPVDLARGLRRAGWKPAVPVLTAAAASMARVPLLRAFAASREAHHSDGEKASRQDPKTPRFEHTHLWVLGSWREIITGRKRTVKSCGGAASLADRG